MATESQDCEKAAAEIFDSDEFSHDYNATDVSDSDSGEEERASSGSENAIVLNIINPCFMQIGNDNVLNFRPVNDSMLPGDSSKIKSENQGQPVLREHWIPSGLLGVGRSRSGFPDRQDHLIQLLVCKNQHTREVLDIAGHYDVTVEVSYEGASDSSLKLPDYKQLLDEVFVISRIIKVEVRVISRSRRLRLITLTETLIILDITKTESNNCFIIH